ncbi:ecotropic viral integration site 5 protein [Entomortierella parvispora]|uniref:Ecotropic viral integration site 5 protein n=1 Tax=Entomortierella parvispora TaxID=205924 RepID=A0A9P3HBW2_9FUNG|nr:ecotropic viral integration site 5 protein [Entomortierella parvispora]
MMVNKHASLTSQDGADYDPLDTYGATSEIESGRDHAKDLTDNNEHTSLVPAPEKPSRNSWEENDSDDEPYHVAAYDYGPDDDDDEDDDEDKVKDKDSTGDQDEASQARPNGPGRTFDQSASEDEDDDGEGIQSKGRAQVKNPNLFLDRATGPRASVNSAKSYSSHTKHHSFGYDEGDRPEPSESESESNSESESDREPFVNASSSPPAPSLLVKSRPTSVSLPAIATLHADTPSPSQAAPVVDATVEVATPQTLDHKENEQDHANNSSLSASSPPASPMLTSTENKSSKEALSPPTILTPDQAQQTQHHQQQRQSSTDSSDSSNSFQDVRSPVLNGHANTTSAQRPNIFHRSVSSTSSARGFVHGQHEPPRSLSYSDTSDAELNEVSLDEPSHEAPRRSTTAAPRAPVAPSTAGFPSSFFGTRPHPKSQQLSHQLPPVAQSGATIASTANTSPTLSASPPEARSSTSRNTSISSIASTIQGAFMSRGFGGGAAPAVPAPRTPSRTSQRGSNAGVAITTGGIDLRPSNNISPERASTFSTMTTDSNMDLLLARLEAQNSMLEQDSKRRATTESEMDRALGHAKEESTSGEDVDWDYWGALMHDYNAVVKKNPKQLTQMIQKGVPPALRGLIWQLLAKSKDIALEEKYAELLKSTSTHEKQITRDMSRTFPNHEHFQADGLGQESLFNVVKAYSLYDPEVGYCQGLSFVVGPLLLNMPDEEAFCVLVRMMNSYDMRGHFTPEMGMLQLRLYQYEQLMEETVPLIAKHFQTQGIRSTMYASQWFMTLFAYKFPLELVFRVYDILFVEGVDSLLRFAIALLKANHDQILNHDFETLIEFLKNGLFEPYMNDASLFIQDAYNVKVTPKKLTQYAQKYQAMIQKQQAELAAEESLKESNRQLSLHVRRLEGSIHTINKEHVEMAKELISRKLEMAQLQDQNDVLTQKVSDLTKIVDSQAKEVEEKYRDEIQEVLQRNVELARKNEKAEDQLAYLENLIIETKMKYAESENEKDALTRKLNDLRKALGAV